MVIYHKEGKRVTIGFFKWWFCIINFCEITIKIPPKRGKVNLPRFLGNGEQLIPIYVLDQERKKFNGNRIWCSLITGCVLVVSLKRCIDELVWARLV